MKTTRDIWLLFQRYTTQLLRNPVWLIVGFSTPVLYLALFTPLLKGATSLPTHSVIEVFLPGILALLAFSTGAATGYNTIFELETGLIERLRVTPASRLAILMGPILSSVAMRPRQSALLPGRRLARPSRRHFANSAVWQAFAVLVPLCGLVLAWATRVFRRAVA